jgi:Glycine-zipper domain
MKTRAMFAGVGMLIALPLAAQEMFFYPSQGQTPEQQSKDRTECQVWAQQQTGVDPTRPAPQVAAAPAQQGQVVRGAARGGLLGVVGGAIGGDVGKGAAIGAGVGATKGLLDRRRDRIHAEQAQQQTLSAQQAGLANFNRALSACMQGRGYSVS